MTKEPTYAIENEQCSICAKTIAEMTEDGEDVLEHLAKHVREDKAN